MSQTRTKHRAIVLALFVTALFGAFVAFGYMGQGEAHAQTVCNIKDFINADGTLDTTGYLGCVSANSAGAVQPGPDCPTADILIMAQADPSTLYVGQVTHFTATSFEPGSSVDVVICSTPVSLGTFTADANGNVDQNVTVPAGTSLGAHTIAAVGHGPNGVTHVAYAAVTVVAQTTTGTLPTTGSDSGRMIAIGAALVVLGGAAIFGSTRARRPATVEAD